MTKSTQYEDLLLLYDRSQHDLRTFMAGVVAYLGEHPDLTIPGRRIVHSYMSRMKDREHLREKIKRKTEMGRIISSDNFFSEITDLAGVRILHLYQDGFKDIDDLIRRKITEGDWHLAERANAYTWDPENASFFRQFDLDVLEKPTSYTSVHYILKPRSDSRFCCELQVRTLFEEIWGEVDHQINYPYPTQSLACLEQIKVLSKIVGAGSRLLDALRRIELAEVGRSRMTGP